MKKKECYVIKKAFHKIKCYKILRKESITVKANQEQIINLKDKHLKQNFKNIEKDLINLKKQLKVILSNYKICIRKIMATLQNL